MSQCLRPGRGAARDQDVQAGLAGQEVDQAGAEEAVAADDEDAMGAHASCIACQQRLICRRILKLRLSPVDPLSRLLACEAKGRWFDPSRPHHFFLEDQ